MKKLFGFFIMLVTLFSLSSCSNGGATHISGDFQYKINTKTDEVMLIGFSDEGKEKETIVLPTLIDGKKVTTIGHKVWYLISSGDGTWTADFSGASCKNLYIHSFISISNVRSGYGIISSKKPADFKIFYGTFFKKSDLMMSLEDNLHHCYIPTIYKNIEDNNIIPKYNSANVVYYLNYKADIKTFFCDDCDGTKVNVIPSDPYRDGYKFLGWYKEEECINQFDFENEIIPKKEYDSNNEYVFKETSLYAKWESSAK